MTKDQLIATSFNISRILASAVEGEPFHPGYRKHKDVFRKLVKSDRRTERKLKNYFKQFAEQRLLPKINWSAYTTQTKKASLIDDMILVDWKDEALLIKVVLSDTLLDALLAGGQHTEKELETDIGFDKDNVPALTALRKHVLKLAGAITETTKNIIKESLSTSIGLGEDTQTAAKRITALVDNPKRAAKIAHTESVNAFTEGQLAVAREIGAKKKEWSATLRACKICSPLDGKVVGIEQEFAPGVFKTPAHPNCRCLIKIRMK